MYATDKTVEERARHLSSSKRQVQDSSGMRVVEWLGARRTGSIDRMIDFLRTLLRGRAALVKGAGKLAEGDSKKIDLGDPLAGGKQVVLCRVEGKLYALDALCPHAGGRIADGPLFDGKHALCPLHNYLFEPQTGRAIRGACANAKTYKVRERDGDCEVWA